MWHKVHPITKGTRKSISGLDCRSFVCVMPDIRYIIIDRKNDVYLKVEADASIRRELSEYFCFEVPGYKFVPAYRNRVWDGKIRLFSYATGEIYAGLYPYILKMV